MFVLPRIKSLGERIEPALEGASFNVDRIAAGHIKHLLLVSLFALNLNIVNCVFQCLKINEILFFRKFCHLF